MIVLIDNYDSFTYNLVQRIGELGKGHEIRVFRNDAAAPQQVQDELHPTHLIISPGPCTPDQAGESMNFIRYFHGKIPVLGGEALGAGLTATTRLRTSRLAIARPSSATRMSSSGVTDRSAEPPQNVAKWPHRPVVAFERQSPPTLRRRCRPALSGTSRRHGRPWTSPVSSASSTPTPSRSPTAAARSGPRSTRSTAASRSRTPKSKSPPGHPTSRFWSARSTASPA